MDKLCIPQSNGVETLRRLGACEEQIKAILPGWGDSFVNMPEKIFFLQKEVLDALQRFFSLSSSVMNSLYSAAETVEKNPDLAAYMWHFYYRIKQLSFSSGASHAGFADFLLPEPLSAVALVACGILRDAIENYRNEGFTQEIIRDTLRVYTDAFEAQVKRGEAPHVALPAINWMRVYLACRLVQLGRFNFKLMETSPFGIVLRNRKSRIKIMLSASEVHYNSRGFVLQQNDPYGSGAWCSRLEEDEKNWYGNVISPAGFALPERRCFSKAEWECILRPGEIMIDMHIPAGGGMTPERALDSFQKAVAFFSRKNPGKFREIFICHSWIFNTQFEEKMPDSNLAKLMRECYLFPHDSSGRDGMFFLFGRDYENLSQAPRDSSQRRAMLEILESGERLRTGGMLLFAEDLPRFGTQCYRNDFKELFT